MKKIRKKVVCAMSGGIDSSVAAALLKKARLDVVGVFMKFWSETEKYDSKGGWNKCCSPEAEVRARKVAKILKIPFYVFNFEKEFKKRVVDDFLSGHKKGITPNPCVVCNKEIKFGLLLEKALALDANYVATGHYVRKREIRENSWSNSCKFAMLEAKDKEKDQSYFLWMLNQKQLRHIIFPIGGYTRVEVEKMAKKFKLPFGGVKKSQEVCFIPKTVEDFLKRYLKSKSGRIVDTNGKTLGKHEGLYFYTIGQRKGIGLASGPYYVLEKDFKKNILIVTKNEEDLYKKELICEKVNWISGKEPKLPLKVKAKIRYRHKASPATIYHLKSNIYHLIFSRPQQAVTPGQSVIFYSPAQILPAKLSKKVSTGEKKFGAGKGQELLGGGIILSGAKPRPLCGLKIPCRLNKSNI